MGRAFLGWTIRHKAGCWKYQEFFYRFLFVLCSLHNGWTELGGEQHTVPLRKQSKKLVGQRIIDKKNCWLLPKHDVLYFVWPLFRVHRASKQVMVNCVWASVPIQNHSGFIEMKGYPGWQNPLKFWKATPIDNLCVVFSTWCFCLGLVKWYFQPKQKRKQVW